jgi:hypothetical protein
MYYFMVVVAGKNRWTEGMWQTFCPGINTNFLQPTKIFQYFENESHFRLILIENHGGLIR